MTASAHALVGASLAAKIVNPTIGLPLALVSHSLLDLIPHWDFGTNHQQKSKTRLFLEASFDVLLGVFLVWLLFRNLVSPVYLWSMVVAAQLPDWIDTFSSLIGISDYKPFVWLKNFQRKYNNKLELPWGLITQSVALAIAVWGLTPVSGGNFIALVFPILNP